MLGKAAVAMWCDVAFDVREEFDDWHVHEHMPERLSIPGFLRGSRWVAQNEGVGYFILYETESEATLTSGPYLERLNNPTPWSRKMMPHHRNMVRGLCRVQSSFGAGLGHAMLTMRFNEPPQPGLDATLAAMPSRKGLVAAYLLRGIVSAPLAQTTEQKLRGGDAAPDWVVLVSGYSAKAVAAVGQEFAHLPGVIAGAYRLAYVLTGRE
jgi:hypothetical protein